MFKFNLKDEKYDFQNALTLIKGRLLEKSINIIINILKKLIFHFTY